MRISDAVSPIFTDRFLRFDEILSHLTRYKFKHDDIRWVLEDMVRDDFLVKNKNDEFCLSSSLRLEMAILDLFFDGSDIALTEEVIISEFHGDGDADANPSILKEAIASLVRNGFIVLENGAYIYNVNRRPVGSVGSIGSVVVT